MPLPHGLRIATGRDQLLLQRLHLSLENLDMCGVVMSKLSFRFEALNLITKLGDQGLFVIKLVKNNLEIEIGRAHV